LQNILEGSSLEVLYDILKVYVYRREEAEEIMKKSGRLVCIKRMLYNIRNMTKE